MSLDRRKFLGLTAMSGAALTLNPFESFAKPFTNEKPADGFKLLIFATNWGYGGTWDEFCDKIKKLGYDGAEIWLPGDDAEQQKMISTFQKYDLKYGFLFGAGDRDYQKHLDGFKTMITKASTLK